MRFPHNTRIFRGQIEAAPFISVFFLLVIFLILQSSFVFTPGLPIQLPVGEGLPGAENPTVSVAVDASGNFYFDNQICDEARLRDQLIAAVTANQEPVTLVVLAHQDAKVDVLLRLGSLASSIGIRNVLQAVRPPVRPRPVGPNGPADGSSLPDSTAPPP